jgi:CIC family chloride channel protein
MSPQEPIVAKPKDASGIKPAVSTPTRRQYWSSLRAMLAPQRFSLREEQFFLLLAVLIGISSGLAVVCFRMCIEFLHLKLLGTGLHPSVPRVFLAPMLAGLVIALLVVRFFPRARGSGVNQTKAALYIYDGYIPMPTVIGKFITSALAIGSGQSLGPEDPALQIGAGLASALGRRLKLSREKLRSCSSSKRSSDAGRQAFWARSCSPPSPAPSSPAGFWETKLCFASPRITSNIRSSYWPTPAWA